MVRVVAWLLEREYRQHRSLDPRGLPERFADWRDGETLATSEFAATSRERVVRMVIHPNELETWARRTGRTVNGDARTVFAALLWTAGRTRVPRGG